MAKNKPGPQEHFLYSITLLRKASSYLVLVIQLFRKRGSVAFEEKSHTGTFLALGEHIFFNKEENTGYRKCGLHNVRP